VDTVKSLERSRIMSKIRSKNNRTTELCLRSLLVRNCLRGWKVRPKGIPGNPDFVFTKERIAIFVDGSFWHGAPGFKRYPKTRIEYWKPKIEGNRRRDKLISSALRRQGWSVLRFWDTDLHDNPSGVIKKIQRSIQQRISHLRLVQ
jgi:DNA mismatch endonuclease (patch repair protein)